MIGQPGINNDVQSRMDAYRGNPQALMQRYAQSQELVDLLALQKLKSEKESAAREMQMQMDAAGMPTVAQQREQEVMDLTKKEVAQQSGLGGQMQAMQKQEAMKQLLQNAGAPQGQTGMPQPQPNQPPTRAPGLPGLPSPNMMPQKAMASGGIVAFAGGDQVPNPDDDERKRRERQSYGEMARSGISTLMGYTPEAVTKQISMTPEERAQREQRIQELKNVDEQFSDPNRRRMEGLARWLLGGAGYTTTGGALAGAGRAGMAYDTEMESAMRDRLLQRQSLEQSMSDADREARMKGYDVGLGALGKAVAGAAGVEEARIRAAASASGNPLSTFSKLQAALIANKDYAGITKQIDSLTKELEPYTGSEKMRNTSFAQQGFTKLAGLKKQRDDMERNYYAAYGPEMVDTWKLVSGKGSGAGAGAGAGAGTSNYQIGKAYKDAKGVTAVYKGKDASGKDIWE